MCFNCHRVASLIARNFSKIFFPSIREKRKKENNISVTNVLLALGLFQVTASATRYKLLKNPNIFPITTITAECYKLFSRVSLSLRASSGSVSEARTKLITKQNSFGPQGLKKNENSYLCAMCLQKLLFPKLARAALTTSRENFEIPLYYTMTSTCPR